MREDPIGIQRGENHLYVYVQNNPINYIDVTGLKKWTPGDFKKWYDRYKDVKSVYKACKPVMNNEGGLKGDCAASDCHDCAKHICDTYAGIGSFAYKTCLDGLFAVCLAVCPCD